MTRISNYQDIVTVTQKTDRKSTTGTNGRTTKPALAGSRVSLSQVRRTISYFVALHAGLTERNTASVGQVAQPSKITGKTQDLPVAISLMSAAGKFYVTYSP